jgi:hypothetical protein
MTRDTAIHLAEQAIEQNSRPEFIVFSAALEQKKENNTWLVVFERKEADGCVMSPGELFVEVDEASETARIVRNP